MPTENSTTPYTLHELVTPLTVHAGKHTTEIVDADGVEIALALQSGRTPRGVEVVLGAKSIASLLVHRSNVHAALVEALEAAVAAERDAAELRAVATRIGDLRWREKVSPWFHAAESALAAAKVNP